MAVRRQQESKRFRPKLSVRRGDHVVVVSGREKGKRGTIERVFPEKNRVTIEGVNLVKRHLRRQPGSLQAGIVDMPAPLHRSNVMLICPNCDRPTRAGHVELPDGKHARTCKHCGEVIDRNE